jgi:hypothetical protein
MNRRESNYVRLRERFFRSEDDMARAMRKWLKLRDSMRRAEGRLDKELAERHSKIGGKLDVRELPLLRVGGEVDPEVDGA